MYSEMMYGSWGKEKKKISGFIIDKEEVDLWKS